MNFDFVLIPSDGAAESLVGGDTSKFSFLPRIGETITFYIPGDTVAAKVSDVKHVYLGVSPLEQNIAKVLVKLQRKDFDRILEAYGSKHWMHYDHTY